MSGKNLNATVPTGVVIAILAIVPLLVGAVEWKTQVLKSNDVPRGVTVNRAYCLKCHSDAKMLKRMRFKEGGARLLFNADGSFRDLDPSSGIPMHKAPWPKG